ncbi:(2Fe-2S)-binding protein [Saccharothrix violaceirubra]|uniref:Ferric siderophore reductase C-terminal domain-containing protein n=1 Tax=Saccharothrix violaceirubra TaxID=413306 RepID=A0A7W7WYT1_9PSEU|nr:(2Fe-2S)-binding protein [Saccharothrix violaceirubra]MBB4968869.1 hypothetical protein [Saccharothrix violaceirubra]
MTVPTKVTARDARSPVADTLAGVAHAAGTFEVRHGLPEQRDGWVTSAELFTEPDRFTAWRDLLADWLRAEYGSAPERTTAGYVMGWYLNVVGLAGGLLFHAARRVPSLRPDDVAVRIAGTGRPHLVGVALLAEGFACLAEDPASDHADATVVGCERALADLMRARFAAHAAAFVSAYGPTVRLGRRTLWAGATDALDSAAWTAGRLLGDETSGVADAALLLPAKLEPFTSATTLRTVDGEWTRRRESCCFHYVLPGAQECVTCPRVR